MIWMERSAHVAYQYLAIAFTFSRLKVDSAHRPEPAIGLVVLYRHSSPPGPVQRVTSSDSVWILTRGLTGDVCGGPSSPTETSQGRGNRGVPLSSCDPLKARAHRFPHDRPNGGHRNHTARHATSSAYYCARYARNILRGRCNSADLRNTQELKGIRTKKLQRQCSVIASFAAGVRIF